MRARWAFATGWLTSAQQRRAMASAAVVMAGVLASFGSALWLEGAAGLNIDVVVLAVVLSLTLGRSAAAKASPTPWQRLESLVVLAAVAAAASEVGTLMARHANVGDTLFVIALSVAVWLRRFGPALARVSTLLTLPFIALLVTPVPQLPGKSLQAWSIVVAVIAAFWVAVTQLIGDRLFPAPVRPRAHRAALPAPARRANGRRLAPSTRMAIQLGVALTAAFVVGRNLYPEHWSWLVLTAYIVSSGNRGRGDVAHKSVLRLVGAAVGTVTATLIAGTFPPLDKTPIVLIFVVLGVATWLRTINYAYWAAAVTAVLSLLNGYFGQTGTALLGDRLEGIAIGAAIGLAAAWFVLPVRTTDVFRRRTADVLAALTDYLTALGSRLAATGAGEADAELHRQEHRLEHALDQLEQIAPTLRAHHRLPAVLRGQAPPPAEAVNALLAIRQPARDLLATSDQAGVQALRKRVIATRQAMVGRGTEPRPASSAHDPIARLERAIDTTRRIVARPA